MYGVLTPFGIFKVDEKGNIVEFEEREVVDELLDRERYKKFLEENNLKEPTEEVLRAFRKNLVEFLEKNYGKERTVKMLNYYISKFSREKIARLNRRDRLIIQVSSAITDLDRILNLMCERLREWYALHYPELEVKDHEKFARLVRDYKKRENFRDFEFSVGMEFSEKDAEEVARFADAILTLFSLRDELDKYLKELVKEEMPNLYELLGHILAAKLLSAAGSMEKLAKMPASTIQLLGAEKALFRYLRSKGKTKPPKHGIIFLHPYIHRAPKKKRGKIARLLASKLAVAARMDYYTKEKKGKELKNELEEKVKEILEEKE